MKYIEVLWKILGLIIVQNQKLKKSKTKEKECNSLPFSWI